MNNDLNLLLVLPIERVFSEPIKEKTLEGWQIFLAEARKRFLIDELLIKNGLSSSKFTGEILEIDQGSSQLGWVLKRDGIRTRRVNLSNYEQDQSVGKFALGVSHNQLEHLSSINFVNRVLDYLNTQSVYGMVHQVHALDDPAFKWDKTHSLRMTGLQWEGYFRSWTERHSKDGWTYLGSHRGASGRPKNFVLERNGSLPYYIHYDEQLVRRIINELTVANGISVARIPLLMLSFFLAGDNPYLLSGFVGAIHVLDALDGYVARKGFGQSSSGHLADIASDHFVELMILFEYAYSKGFIPTGVPWIIAARNSSVDLLRLYNAFDQGLGMPAAHPHEAFGTNGQAGKIARTLYGVTKALGDMIIPIIPSLGISIAGIHIGASIARAIPVWTSSTSQKIYKEILERFSGQRL